MLAACLLIALDDDLVFRLDVENFDIQIRLALHIQQCPVRICKHIPGAQIRSNCQLLQMIFRLPADVHEFSHQLRRQVIDTVIADILQYIHDHRFSGAGHSGHYNNVHSDIFCFLHTLHILSRYGIFSCRAALPACRGLR